MGHQSESINIMSDERIIQLYFQRDEEAIYATDTKYKRLLLSIADNIVHNMSDSEECLNDTYMETWNSIPPTRPNFLRAFLVTIMRRKAINCYKSRNCQKRVSSELTVSLSDIEEFTSDKPSEIDPLELGKVISDFIRSLSQRQMYIFMSRYYIARPIKEISKLLDCSESTVNKEIRAIKQSLKEKLEKEGYIL